MELEAKEVRDGLVDRACVADNGTRPRGIRTCSGPAVARWVILAEEVGRLPYETVDGGCGFAVLNVYR